MGCVYQQNFNKAKKLLAKFKKHINSDNKNYINIYKYTDYIIELDSNLLSILDYKVLIDYVTLIYYYQIILFCKTLDVNRNIKNFLKFLPLIYKIINIKNSYVERLRLGLFKFNYDTLEYMFLDNYRDFYDTILISYLPIYINNPLYIESQFEHEYESIKDLDKIPKYYQSNIFKTPKLIYRNILGRISNHSLKSSLKI